jgi:hypothetical protein
MALDQDEGEDQEGGQPNTVGKSHRIISVVIAL